MKQKEKLMEELTKQDVRRIVSDEIDNTLYNRDFKKKVVEITIDVLDKFFQQMWNRKSMWKSGLKNG